MKKLLGILVLGLLVLVLNTPAKANCGRVEISKQNWGSAEFMAELDKIILEKVYGCTVDLYPGATMTSFKKINNNNYPIMNPEQWSNAVYKSLIAGVDARRLHIVNEVPITDVGEGWWISPATAERYPNLKTVLDIIDNPDLFGGKFISCPKGWGCSIANKNMFKAFNMKEKGWKIVDPGSARGLDSSISKAVKNNENWFGYYWSPTSIVGKYNLVKLDWGVPWAGRNNWDKCIMTKNCSNPSKTSWTTSDVYTIANDKFKMTAGPEVMNYLNKRTIPNSVMNNMLVYMSENRASGKQAAEEFVKRNEKIWKEWVSSSVAKKEPKEETEIVKKPKKKKPKDQTKKKKPKDQAKKKPQSSEIDPNLIAIGSGTGFYINNKGYALTNNHVVEICKQVTTIVEGKEILFNVVGTDQILDIGLIKTKHKVPAYLNIETDGAKLGEDVIAVGYPLAGQLSDSVKITKGIVSALSGIGNNTAQIQIDAALQPGNSGGPIINKSGDVVGIASAGLNKLLMAKEAKYIPENVNFAVAAPSITNFLKAKKTKFSTASFFSKEYSTYELAEIGQKATVQLFCLNTRAAYAKLKKSKKYTDVLLNLD